MLMPVLRFTLAALTGGKVQVADVFTTTPQIITDHLVSLSDPKANFARVKNNADTPWQGAVETLDKIGAPASK